MSGYRDTSSFDPNAGSSDKGPPMRPFSQWQWLGVGLGVLGALVVVGDLASRIGLLGVKLHDSMPAGTSLLVLGTVLVNSRRQPGGLIPEPSRKRMIIIGTGLVVFGTAALVTIFVLKGA